MLASTQDSILILSRRNISILTNLSGMVKKLLACGSRNSCDHKSLLELQTRIRVDRSNPSSPWSENTKERFYSAASDSEKESDHPPAIWLITTHLTETHHWSLLNFPLKASFFTQLLADQPSQINARVCIGFPRIKNLLVRIWGLGAKILLPE